MGEKKKNGKQKKASVPNFQDVLLAASRMAFGRANDCVKLATQKNPLINQMDLELLSEVRRSEKGAIDIRLVDRIAAIRLLAELLGKQEGNSQAALASLSAEF